MCLPHLTAGELFAPEASLRNRTPNAPEEFVRPSKPDPGSSKTPAGTYSIPVAISANGETNTVTLMLVVD